MTEENPWDFVITSGTIWPLVHVFVPAAISLYVPDFWHLLSFIYLFESFEYVVSTIPMKYFKYWSEVSNADSLVSDILMGVLGYYAIYALPGLKNRKKSWYAFLNPTNSSYQWYRDWYGFLHVALQALASLLNSSNFEFVEDGDPFEFICFSASTVIVPLLFGYQNFAIFALIIVSIVSVSASFFGYTLVLCLGLVPVLVWVSSLMGWFVSKTNEDPPNVGQAERNEENVQLMNGSMLENGDSIMLGF